MIFVCLLADKGWEGNGLNCDFKPSTSVDTLSYNFHIKKSLNGDYGKMVF